MASPTTTTKATASAPVRKSACSIWLMIERHRQRRAPRRTRGRATDWPGARRGEFPRGATAHDSPAQGFATAREASNCPGSLPGRPGNRADVARRSVAVTYESAESCVAYGAGIVAWPRPWPSSWPVLVGLAGWGLDLQPASAASGYKADAADLDRRHPVVLDRHDARRLRAQVHAHPCRPHLPVLGVEPAARMRRAGPHPVPGSRRQRLLLRPGRLHRVRRAEADPAAPPAVRRLRRRPRARPRDGATRCRRGLGSPFARRCTSSSRPIASPARGPSTSPRAKHVAAALQRRPRPCARGVPRAPRPVGCRRRRRRRARQRVRPGRRVPERARGRRRRMPQLRDRSARGHRDRLHEPIGRQHQRRPAARRSAADAARRASTTTGRQRSRTTPTRPSSKRRSTTPSCANGSDRGVLSDTVVYCSATNTITYSTQTLNRAERTIGDLGAGVFVAAAWSSAVQHQLGVKIGTGPARASAECLTGAWAGGVEKRQRREPEVARPHVLARRPRRGGRDVRRDRRRLVVGGPRLGVHPGHAVPHRLRARRERLLLRLTPPVRCVAQPRIRG